MAAMLVHSGTSPTSPGSPKEFIYVSPLAASLGTRPLAPKPGSRPKQDPVWASDGRKPSAVGTSGPGTRRPKSAASLAASRSLPSLKPISAGQTRKANVAELTGDPRCAPAKAKGAKAKAGPASPTRAAAPEAQEPPPPAGGKAPATPRAGQTRRRPSSTPAGAKRPSKAAPAEVTESEALSSISQVAASVAGDLDKVIASCGSMEERLSVFTLREISIFSTRLKNDLARANQEMQAHEKELERKHHEAASNPQPPPPVYKYDDPLLARARRIAELTNQLCDDIDNTSSNYPEQLQASKDAGSLSEIALVTRQVRADMEALQAEEWAVGVLACVPRADEERKKEEALRRKEEARIREEEARRKAEEEAEQEIEGIGDMEAFLADAVDDTVSDAEIEKWKNAFKRFKIPDSADIGTSDVVGLLQYLGHVITDEDKVMPIVQDITTYAYLDFDEFLSFMDRYIPFERAQIKIVFETYDEDGSGEIDLQELRELMTGLGFIPLHAMMAEALAVVDKDKNVALDFDELVRFLACFRHAEGFARQEVADLRKVFDTFAKRAANAPNWDGPKEKKPALLPGDMLCDALVQAFGLHVSEFADQFETQIKSGAGLQKSAFETGSTTKVETLTFAEFLIFARKTRELSMKALIARCPALAKRTNSPLQGEDAVEFETFDKDGDGKIGMEEIKEKMKEMGYTALKQNVTEILMEVDKDGNMELDFNEFFDFSLIYREREGFSKKALDAMKGIFQKYDNDGSGEISCVELGSLFRNLGYRASLDELQTLVVQVDENGSQQLDFREYLKLMRLHREDELTKYKGGFKEGSGGEEMLEAESVQMALESMDYELPERLRSKVTEMGQLDFDDFVAVIDEARTDIVARERKKAGFTDERIATLQDMFNTYDKDGSGEIDTSELMDILREFDWLPSNKKEQEALVKKINSARALTLEAGVKEIGGEGDIVFWTFVQLCRILETEQEDQEEEMMKSLMLSLQLSPREVDEFREVFNSRIKEVHERDGPPPDEGPGGKKQQPGLPKVDVQRLVRSLGVTLTGENKDKLEAQMAVLDCSSTSSIMAFPNFLRLMRWIMDTNYGGVAKAKPAEKKKPGTPE